MRKSVHRALMVLGLALASRSLGAQAGLGHADDATTAPKGHLRFRALAAWTRYDARFTPTASEPLGAPFTSDSLGPETYAGLLPLQTTIRSAAQLGVRLSLGTSRMDATAREEVLPLAFDFGVTNRLAIGVTVPIVRKRITTQMLLDSTGANVGPNLHRTLQGAAQANTQVQAQFNTAANMLQARVASCQQNPSGAGCATVLADGPRLLAESQSFASDLAQLYGSATGSGFAFVPRASSAAQAAIESRVSDFNTRYRALLGTDEILARPVGATGPPGVAEFHSFVVNDLGGDSLSSMERVGIGDVEIGAKVRVLDRPVTDTRRLGLQMAVAAGVRLPTGSRERASEVVDMSLGEGEPIVDLRAALDARLGRFGLLALAQASGRASDTASLPAARRETRWTEVHVAPRWHLSQSLAFHGAYSYRSTDLRGDQLVGAGVSIMSLGNYLPGMPLPVEMRFTHIEAIGGDPGRPKFFREQLELRVYYRLLGR